MNGAAAGIALSIALSALGCGEAAKRETAASPLARTARHAGRVEVLSGKPNRTYEVLGWVAWPPKGMFMLFSVPCSPDKLREAALEKYGERVDAIIGYEEWREPPAQLSCGGSAVHYEASVKEEPS